MQKQIKAHPKTTILILFLIVLAATIFIGGYRLNWAWTGFTGEKETYRTFYDWMQLLIIPVVVGFGAVWFTTRQGKVADSENKDNQREIALQPYIDKMSELLLRERLGEPDVTRQVETIARARTATVLRILDPARRGSVIRFLSQAGILVKCTDTEYAIAGTDLHGADLSNLNLQNANLSSTNLSGAYFNDSDLRNAFFVQSNLRKACFIGADLRNTTLTGSDLEQAILFGANVTDEQLAKAKSLKGATMLNQSIQP